MFISPVSMSSCNKPSFGNCTARYDLLNAERNLMEAIRGQGIATRDALLALPNNTPESDEKIRQAFKDFERSDDFYKKYHQNTY